MRTCLPNDWQEQILQVSARSVAKDIIPTSVTSREEDPKTRIPVLTVRGDIVREELPWLYQFYKGLFRNLAQLSCNEPVYTAEKDHYGAVLNVQRGTSMRYESHVDSNPIEGLLYVTDHPKGSGGELVVANNPNANSVKEIEADCSIVYPIAGNLIFFDARRFPHYVRPLKKDDDMRIVVAMNFYTPSCSESARPKDLDMHLFGSPPSQLSKIASEKSVEN